MVKNIYGRFKKPISDKKQMNEFVKTRITNMPKETKGKYI